MSQENVELVRAVYEALNKGDWDAAFRKAHANFELTLQRSPNAGTHRGRQRVQAVLEDQQAAFDDSVMELEQLIESGDRVVAIVRTRMRPKGTSSEFEIRNGFVWTIREGTIVSVLGFPEPEKARAAVGQSGPDAHPDF